MEYNLDWTHMSDFKIGRAHSASSIWNHKYHFRPELHETNIYEYKYDLQISKYCVFTKVYLMFPA